MQESQAESLSARDHVERELRSKPDLSYAEVQASAERLGLNVPRFLYGSTRRALGLPPRLEAMESNTPRERPADRALGADVAAEPEPIETEVEPGERRTGTATRSHGRTTDDRPTDEPAGGEQAEPAPKKTSAFDFAVETLRMSPDISFQDLKARAGMAGLKLPPIVYGRAKALLGLVPTRPRRPRIEAPRILRQVESASDVERLPTLDGIRSVEQLVATVRTLEAERQRLNGVLREILAAVEDALSAED